MRLIFLSNLGGGGGGRGEGDVNRWTDEDVPNFFALELVPKNLIFALKTPPKNLFYNILHLSFQQGNLEWTAIFVSDERCLCHFLNFS